MKLDTAIKISGWMNEPELEYLATAAHKSEKIAEIGSWHGRSTVAIAENTSGQVWAIDTWQGSDEPVHQQLISTNRPDWVMNEFIANTHHCENITIIRASSINAAAYLHDHRFDFIFIDAAHDYESVYNDIKAWQPLLKENGILSGHDYAPNWPGVVKAVQELIPSFRVVEGGSIWTTEK